MTTETLIFLFLLFSQTCNGRDTSLCAPSSCGNIHNISYPFRLQTDPNNCGDHRFELSCENNFTVLNLFRGRYYVHSINYDNFTIRLADAGVHQDDCSSFPRFPLPIDYYYYDYGIVPYSNYKYQWTKSEEDKWAKLGEPPMLSQMIIFIKCPNPVYSPLYVDTAPCVLRGFNSTVSALKRHYSYVNIGDMKLSDLKELCRVEIMSLFPVTTKKNMSWFEIHRELAFGFQLSWHNIFKCEKCDDNRCYLDSRNSVRCMQPPVGIIYMIGGYLAGISIYGGMLLAARCLCGTPCVMAFIIYKWRRRHLSGYNTIEEFLQSHNNLMPIRYSYSDIKKITGGFKEKLGEGGFGSVYKGKLRSGQFAAVKILNKPKDDGQDFINEVATIGKIHHVNVVQLIGFCAERSKQALIYEFMSKGSLNNYIDCHKGSVSLSWEKLYKISLGVAHGIEYLHLGCDMQILHFDIKPHNILLDENFTPKISDFGLAKFYPTKGSIASLTAKRGTLGYMAPEIFYKNIGRVSHKADVYSFGQLVLEVADRGKKVNGFAESLSEVYSPFRVYDQLSSGNLPIEETAEEENIKARKMIITGLWCVQFQPSDRPAMNKVVEMLEGDIESLQMPPRPVLFPADSVTTESNSLAENPSQGTFENILLSVTGEG
ncbi:LEAF RUST 10 DISEASE-RESISTANCE LOCUS RECEPTOR-LIKE PROTEIN KINASE-like 2.4 isoform X2 [Hevea brasiliensis]|uniref:LEAF RUST 10 DISEASE-RESISTANCE LOCUS RECEPTOR-LIKE PROTEIN KINASE-like 2.4 isoform X2 n=1 Tax=Hevea brasiliensis TaxID=3981 RepID=UPI0025FB7A37|nr:LEAF RUST 10 DISEASE-RESISTANCE LOCUS RECEPTOR-LIKE PROTEIN KINASE-like 2.4 isoform X2 [Hevea brasiliensis]